MHTIYETVHGSRAYGLAREGSDLDLKGVLVGPRDWYFGHRAAPEQIELGPDHVRYEVRKLLRLLCNANPTVLEVLFTHPRHHQIVTVAGRRLLESRQLFVTRKVAQSFLGYADGQLKRLETHRRWHSHPPAGPPSREEFGLPAHMADAKPLSKSDTGAAAVLLEQGTQLSANLMELLRREKRYQAALTRWSQFQQYLRHRNPRRAELEKKFGYDTKHAMHLIRLQRMGLEILQTGEVIVERKDRDELLAVRDGAWDYPRLQAEAQKNRKGIEAALPQSPLPDAVDDDEVRDLSVELIETTLS